MNGRGKIGARHLDRLAVVCVRQSSTRQVLENRESTSRQHALRDHALALGWPSERIVTIDADLGVSGSASGGRKGCERLKQEVSRGRVGAVLGLEVSRFSRNGRDWHALLEICAVVGCLVGDRDRIHDPAAADDRAFLGIKGQFADMELAIFRQRSLESREALAGRGELFLHLPAGFEKVDRHSIAKTPDQHRRDAIDMVFRKFRELRSIRQVHLRFRRRGIRIPVRDLGRAGVAWRVPRDSTLASMLRNPTCAGACVCGRRRQEVTVDAGGTRKMRGGIMKPEDEWSVLLRDRHEGCTGWDECERNRRVIEANAVGNRGAPRAGKALLAGLPCCGRCRRRLQVADNGKSHRHRCQVQFKTDPGFAFKIDPPAGLFFSRQNHFCRAFRSGARVLLEEKREMGTLDRSDWPGLAATARSAPLDRVAMALGYRRDVTDKARWKRPGSVPVINGERHFDPPLPLRSAPPAISAASAQLWCRRWPCDGESRPRGTRDPGPRRLKSRRNAA